MSNVIRLISERMPRLDAIERVGTGYRFTQDGHTTTLAFRSLDHSAGVSGVTAIATVETLFAPASLPPLNEVEVAWLNRRAVHGAFLPKDDGQLGCQISCSLHEHEPDADWIAEYLILALQQQSIIGFELADIGDVPQQIGVAWSMPPLRRQWITPAPDAAFEEIAKGLEELNYQAFSDSNDLIVLVPMGGGEAALARVTTGIQHPLAGAGYLATLKLPELRLGGRSETWCTLLNDLEHRKEDFVPRLGAWSLRGADDEIVYGMFLPAVHGSGLVVGRLAEWLIRRAFWISDRYWVPGIGLRLPEETAG